MIIKNLITLDTIPLDLYLMYPPKSLVRRLIENGNLHIKVTAKEVTIQANEDIPSRRVRNPNPRRNRTRPRPDLVRQDHEDAELGVMGDFPEETK